MLELKNISKSYGTQLILDNISFTAEKNSLVSILGPSGSGKSTLLQIIGLLSSANSGDVVLDEYSYLKLSDSDKETFRNKYIGFVFQFHYLLHEFSCLKNVMIPALKLGKLSEKEIEERAYQKLKILGLEDQALKPANKLSGGQQQRVAIARALINDPLIILGDEPTGNLDSKNSNLVFDIFQDLTMNFGQTIIAVTHDDDFARKSDRIIELKDGKIIK